MRHEISISVLTKDEVSAAITAANPAVGDIVVVRYGKFTASGKLFPEGWKQYFAEYDLYSTAITNERR
jgi:hypothetical protein